MSQIEAITKKIDEEYKWLMQTKHTLHDIDIAFNSIKKFVRDLEQEPYDCVSRKSLLDKLDPLYKEKIKTAPDNMAEGFLQVSNLIKNESPVTPTRKKGKWICVHHIENKITYDSWKCSECQHDFNSEEESMVYFDEYNYYPNCGAEMEDE